MREKKDIQSDPLPVYESHPPGWLPKIHSAADLGYIGFHPPRPGQDEDVLSASNVKNGFTLSQPVVVDYFSAQDMLNGQLKSPEVLTKLEQLMDEVFVRRTERIPSVAPSNFRIPTRVTLNDAKRQAWLADLANPDVPLYKLGKSVPHGARGHDLLDLMHSNNVEISRAVWFLRVFGANETAGLRNKPSYIPTQYSVDWANVVTGYIKKLLVEIALPSAPRPGLNIKQTFKGVLADTDTRERWMSRFTYCLKLLRTFYAQDLVDHRVFLTWLVQHMNNCNLAQAGFLTRLAGEYLDGILASRALSKSLVEACLSKLSEIRTTSAREYLIETEGLLKHILQQICLTIPDAFVSPKTWDIYANLLDEISSEDVVAISNSRPLEHSIQVLHVMIIDGFNDIKRRNDSLSFRFPIPHVSARLGAAVSDIKLLNSISGDTDMTSISYFSQDISDPCFKEKLDMLLTWSVTPLQYGDHRPFAAVTIIRIWRDKARERASRRDIATPSEFLQDQLFDWLDTSDVAGDSNNIRYVALLYGKLVKHEIFSYATYIQRLIARGEYGLANSQSPGSRHRLFLSWIPLVDSTPLINQRKVILHGSRVRDSPEDATEKRIRTEIREVMADFFNHEQKSTWTSRTTLLEHCKTLMIATRFEQVRTFRQWLLRVFKNNVAKITVDHTTLFKAYLIAIELMSSTQCFNSALDLTLSLLDYANDSDSMNSLINTLCRFRTIWTCMDAVSLIVQALDTAQQLWKQRGHVPSRHMLTVLLWFDNGRYLSSASRDQVTAAITTFTLALQPIVDQSEVMPEILPEILLLAGDPDPNAPSTLANGLWIKYRSSMDWAWKVWDNTIASLRQIPRMLFDLEARHACATRYGQFLWRVNEHLPNGLDSPVLEWLLGPTKAEIMALDAESWDILKTVLSFLVVHDALETTTILQGIVYPAWQLCANDSVSETYLAAANSICSKLLLQDDANENTVPPSDLFEIQCIQTRRQSVYDEPHFSLLVGSIPTLIALETNEKISENLRLESTTLRCRLCQESCFRRAAYRNLELIRQTFENSSYLMDPDPSTENLSKRAISGLKIILCDSSDDANLYDWPEVNGLLTPWKITATTIQLQLQLRQLGRALSHESTSESATANLNQLTTMLFRNIKTTEEAYYVGEMARGADSTVAAKFINNGFQSITEYLTLEQSRNNLSDGEGVHHVGELLSVLIHVSQPFRDNPSLLSVETSVHESFTIALEKRFKVLEREILGNDIQSHSTENLIHLSRLLQFILSFRSTWSPKVKEIYLSLSNLFFRFALHYGSGDNLDTNVYPTLIDTLLVLYDEIQSDSKSVVDPCRHYAKMPISEIPCDMPPEYRRQVMAFLANIPTHTTVTNLINTFRDSHGNLVMGTPVVNRPWEWIENLGEPTADPKEEKERLRTPYLIKNSGSISLEHFNARITGDGIRQNLLNNGDELGPEAEHGHGVIEGCQRTFVDGLSENVFVRDWRESRLEPEISSLEFSRGDLDTDHLIVIDPNAMHHLNRPSPTSSIISRSSTQATILSLRQQQQSPSTTTSRTSTSHEVIDVDNLPAFISSSTIERESAKRKADVSMSDDEVEIIEGPHVSNRSQNGSVKRQKVDNALSATSTIYLDIIYGPYSSNHLLYMYCINTLPPKTIIF